MTSSIAAMATAVLEMTRKEADAIEASQAALQGTGITIDEAAIDRFAISTDAAIFLHRLVPHEDAVLALLRKASN